MPESIVKFELSREHALALMRGAQREATRLNRLARDPETGSLATRAMTGVEAQSLEEAAAVVEAAVRR